MSNLVQKSGSCKNCRVTRDAALHLVLGQNGARKFTWVCKSCNRQGCFGDPFYIPNEKVLGHLTPEQIESLPIIMPDASNRCVRCGDRESELHHWAPKEIFGKDEAEGWPKDYLCVPCHLQWHDTINSHRNK
jgi:hypothetical protein